MRVSTIHPSVCGWLLPRTTVSMFSGVPSSSTCVDLDSILTTEKTISTENRIVTIGSTICT